MTASSVKAFLVLVGMEKEEHVSIALGAERTGGFGGALAAGDTAHMIEPMAA